MVPGLLSAEVVTIYKAKSAPGTTQNINTEFALDTAAKTGTYDNDGAYQDIYGAYNRLVGAGGSSSWGVAASDPGSGCRVRLNDSSAGNAAQTLHLFKTEGISFNAENDAIQTKLILTDGYNFETAQVRIVIEQGGQFYISDPSSDFGGVADGKVYRAPTFNALSTSWYSYDPTTVNGISVIGAAATPTFENIGFVGFNLYAEGTDSGDGTGENFGVREFTVSNIPEPATIGLLAISSTGILFLRRCMLI
jgi:hypothetical protein